MRIDYPLLLAATLLSACPEARAAERLQPLSTTAISITGPVTLAPDRLTIGRGAVLKLRPTGNVVAFDGGFGTGTIAADLYHILTSDDPVLIRGNRLCGGGKPLTYLLVWTSKGIGGPVTTLTPSISATPPATLNDVCGTYVCVAR